MKEIEKAESKREVALEQIKVPQKRVKRSLNGLRSYAGFYPLMVSWWWVVGMQPPTNQWLKSTWKARIYIFTLTSTVHPQW